MKLRVEAGPAGSNSRCACCGEESETAHGFVYRNNDAYAVYYAGWSIGHLKQGVSLAVAIGEWGEGTGAGDRTSFGMSVTATTSSLDFTILDAKESPWGDSPLFGKMLNRSEALAHSEVRSAINIAEQIVKEDARVRRFLDSI
jgi:hypothetical protein